MKADEIAECMTDLYQFTKVMFKARKGSELKENWHQKAICDALERVVIGKTSRLIINIPPRSGKTELAVVNFIAWCMGNFPESEFIHASYSKRLATNNTYQARSVMQNEVYTQIFGPPKFQDDSNAKDEFRTSSGGIVYATGADGSITGFGAGGMGERFKGAIIIDDPHKAGEGNSETMRNNVLDWFSTTMESRKNSPNTPIILIMQRLHEKDLSGFLLAGGNGEHWDHLNVPAVNSSGESFWPEQFPLDDLQRLERSNSYRYAGQYMQNPAPIGGGIFKTAWWQFYTVLPQLKYRVIIADTAQKTKEQNDYSVFQCWGMGIDGRIYLIDMIRGKWEAPELLLQARAFWEKHSKATYTRSVLRKMMVEDKSSGTGLIQQLRPGIPVEGIPRSTDKVSRAMDVAPQIQVGNVVLPDPSIAPWLSDLLAEAEQFPNAEYDDTMDPLMDAVNEMLIDTTFTDYGSLL